MCLDSDIPSLRQVFPNHIVTIVKSRKSQMKLISQRQAARPVFEYASRLSEL